MIKGIFLTDVYDPDLSVVCKDCAHGTGLGLSHDEATEVLEYEFSKKVPAECPNCGQEMIAYDTGE